METGKELWKQARNSKNRQRIVEIGKEQWRQARNRGDRQGTELKGTEQWIIVKNGENRQRTVERGKNCGDRQGTVVKSLELLGHYPVVKGTEGQRQACTEPRQAWNRETGKGRCRQTRTG